ncbi:MAG: hypothetical protein IJD16_09580 [Desulfovibrio sp.]|nr:hypothetical protein [Desulfovibrio sp.]
MSRVIVFILVLACLLLPLAAAAATVPSAANSIGKQLDQQLMMRYAGAEDPSTSRKQQEAVARAQIFIMGTTPADINDLNRTSPLARQMTEEVSRWLMAAGYRYQELRTGKYIRFDRRSGELILTREVNRLTSRMGTAPVLLAGTYLVSGGQVRFTMSLIHAGSREVLAKATATVPFTDDIYGLLEDPMPGSGTTPSTYTRLQ